MDWSRYRPFFAEQEFRCKHTGLVFMQQPFMDVLLEIRKEFGKAMLITSGYRHRTHPAEAGKTLSGAHSQGVAADVAVDGGDALVLVSIALAHGIQRIGVQQKGAARFIHLDAGGPGLPSPMIWSY